MQVELSSVDEFTGVNIEDDADDESISSPDCPLFGQYSDGDWVGLVRTEQAGSFDSIPIMLRKRLLNC